MVDLKMYPEIYENLEPTWYRVLAVLSIILNVFGMLISIFLLILGIYYEFFVMKIVSTSEHGLSTVALAGLLFCISAIGCCAVSNRSSFLTKTFIIISILTVVVLIVYALITFEQIKHMEILLNKHWNALKGITITEIQTEYECCGWEDANANDCMFNRPCKSILVETAVFWFKMFGISYVSVACVLILGVIFSKFLTREPSLQVLRGMHRAAVMKRTKEEENIEKEKSTNNEKSNHSA